MKPSMVTPGLTGTDRLEAAAGRSPGELRNVETAKRVLEGFARGNFSVLASNLAPGATTWVLGLTAESLGGSAIADVFSGGMHFDIKSAAAEVDRVFLQWEDEADTSTGHRYENHGVSVFAFDSDGRITSYHEYIDPANLYAVLTPSV